MTQFTIKKLESDYSHSDIVLIPRKFRGGIRPSKCCKLTNVITGITRIVQVYGKADDDEANIYMDLQTRNHFGISLGSVVDFNLRPVGWLGQILWASRNADLTVRMAAQLGVISVALGIVGAVLGAIGLWIARTTH